MRSASKFVGFIVALTICYVFVDFLGLNEEAEVDGWPRNFSRNATILISNLNVKPKLFPKKICDNDTFLLMMVCTAPNRFEARDAIRKTWGKSGIIHDKKIEVNFLIGKVNDEKVQGKLEEEHYYNGDLIQENFMDSYYNLTVKSFLMLKTVKEHCLNSRVYVFKIDDDMFVDVRKMLTILQETKQNENLLMGKVHTNTGPIRSSYSKWYTPKYLYQHALFPDYLSGTGYVMTAEVAVKLFETALKTPLFHLEDVYFTGFCASRAGIKRQNNDNFTFLVLDNDICEYSQFAVIHHFSPQMILDAYEADFGRVEFQKSCKLMKKVFNAQAWLMNYVIKPCRSFRKNRCTM